MSQPEGQSSPARDQWLSTSLVLFACICFGLIPFFARSLTDAGMASSTVAFYRYGLSALILLPLIRVAAPLRPAIIWGVVSGASIGLGWIGFVEALKTVPVSSVGVLYMTYPVFTLLIGWIGFGDRPSNRGLGGAALVLLAAALSGSPAAISSEQLPALLVSLGAPLSFGLGINILVHRMTALRPLARVGSFSLGATLSLLPLVASSSDPVLPVDGIQWALVAGLAIGTALVPQLIYSTFAPRIGAARSAVAGSIELPTMFFAGALLLGEVIGPLQWSACVLVVLAILLTPARSTRNLMTQLTVPEKAGGEKSRDSEAMVADTPVQPAQARD